MTKIKAAIYTFFTLILVFGACYWLIAHEKTVSVYKRLQQYSETIQRQTVWPNRLQHEKQLLTLIDQSQVRRYTWLGMTEVDTIYQRISKQYQHDLAQNYIPYLKAVTIDNLRRVTGANPLALYQATKAYLLATTKHQDNAFQLMWYQQQLPSNMQAMLVDAQRFQLIHWPVDPYISGHAQSELRKLDPATLNFLVMQNTLPNRLQPIHFKQQQPAAIQPQPMQINELYSSQLFFDIYNKKIPQLVESASFGDWVTGTFTPTPMPKSTLVQQVQDLYLKQFQITWQQVLQQTHLTQTKGLNQLMQLISLLQQHNGPVWHLMTTLNNNATLYSQTPDPISNFLSGNRGYQGFQAALFMLHKHVQKLQLSKKADQLSFELATKHMNDINSQDDLSLCFAAAKQLPPPMNNWLSDITSRLWHIELANSHKYIQHQWQTSVLPPYRKYIASRYPITSYAKSEISRKHFDDFFAPDGTLDQYYTKYLQAFVSPGTRHWTLKNKNGQQLSLAKTHLDMFTRAHLIQRMFYSKSSHHHASTEFAFNATALPAHTQRAILNIEGQMYTVTPKHLTAQQFKWPGSYPGFVTVQLTDRHGKSETKTYTGPWALFHMIDQSRLTTTRQLNQYRIHLNLAKSGADLILTTRSIVNPFIPHILEQFRCPKTL